MINKKIVTFALLLGTAPFLVQCASQEDVKNLNYQIRIVNKKVDEMRAGTVDKLQQRQASSSSQMEDLKREVMSLQSQVDELTHFNRMLKEQSKEFETSLSSYSTKMQQDLEKERKAMASQQEEKDRKIQELQAQLANNQQMLKSIQQSRIQEAQRKADEAAKAAEAARRRASSSSTSPSVISVDKSKKIYSDTSAKTSNKPSVVPATTSSAATTTARKPAPATAPASGDGLDAADAAYANGEYSQAFSLYEKYVNSAGTGDKAVTARFMMGECLYFEKKYDQAILQYQKIISNNPNHSRAASALLKQAMSFESISDLETAKIIYRKLMTSYPSSPEAAKAKERSAKLK